jgi:hypothetical protein
MTTLPQVQVLVDWVNNPIGVNAVAGNNFTDISAYVLLSQGVNIARGRQDNISVVQPSRCTFTLTNDDGRFTPGKTSSPYFPGVIIGRRIQVNVKDESGTYRTRFDGMISEIDVLDTPTGAGTMVRLVCTDVLAFLNRYPEFACWTSQETSYQATPVLQYLCDEDSSAGVLRDSSGNNGPALAPATYASPPYTPQDTASGFTYWDNPTYTFQGGNSPVEGAVDPLGIAANAGSATPTSSPISSPLPSIFFNQTLEQALSGNTATFAAASSQFQGTLNDQVIVRSGSAFTLLAYIWPAASSGITNVNVSNPFEIVCLSNTRNGAMLSLEMSVSGGDPRFQAAFYSNYLTASPSGTVTGGPAGDTYFVTDSPFMVGVVVNGTTATFYLGGNLYKSGQGFNLTGTSTITIPSGTTFNFLSIGGPIGGGNGFIGNVSLVTMYDSALSSGQMAGLAQWGAIGPETQLTGTVFSRAAFAYTGVPSYWQGTVDPGLSTCDYVDITGSNPATVIQNVQAVEHGLVFVDATGKLNFHDRSRRMGATTSPVTFPAGSYDPGIAPKVNDQYLINYASYQNERGGSGVVAQDQESIDQYGVYPNGSVTAPQTAPYMTWAFTARILSATNPTNENQVSYMYTSRNIFDAASWDVNTQGQPSLKLAALSVDRLGNQSGQDEYIAPSVLYGLEINQPVHVDQNLPWWPDAPLASELFIEGVNETYSDREAKVNFYTSPAFQSRAWIPGNSTYGQLDVSARVGISDLAGVAVPPNPFTLGDSALVWPPVPSYSSGMNLGAGDSGFIGAYDQAGISENLQRMITPPMLFVAQKNTTSTFGTGAVTMVWDTTLLDTAGGFNLYNEGSVSYSVMVQGWYEVCTTVCFASGTSGACTVWIQQNQSNIRIPAGLRNIAPATCAAVSSGATGLSTSAVIYCYTGDNISVSASNSGFSWSTSNANGGSHLSIRYLGQGANRN